MSEKNKIYVEIKNLYGVELIYPKCKKGWLFTKLTNKTCLTNREIDIIKTLNYNVEVIQKTL